ncbi:MAG: alpha/beta fold hydrolase [Nitrososphaeria archaeon]
MGGAIAQELAINYPERVKTLTLQATWPKTDGLLKDVIEGWKIVSESEEFKNNRVCFMKYLIWTWCFTHRFYEKSGIEELVKLAAENPYPQPSFVFLGQADACLQHDTLSRFDRIRVPTHVIVGEEDILLPPRYSRVIAARVRRSTLTVIKEVGHDVAAEKP